MDSNKNILCPNCGSSKDRSILSSQDYRFKLTNSRFDLIECHDCGLIFLFPIPNLKESINYYPDEESYYGKPNKIFNRFSNYVALSKVNEIEKFMEKGKILDLGCGTGDFLSKFDETKWEKFGVEISNQASKTASKISNVIVFNSELIDCKFPDNYFDVVSANHVLEHLYNFQETISEIHRILKDGGIFYIRLPNISSNQYKLTGEYWLHLDVPRHINFFSPDTLSQFLRNSGFEVVHTGYPALEYPLDIFHSIKRKVSNTKGDKGDIYYFIYAFPYIFLKLFASWRGTFLIISKKRGKK